MQLFTDPKTCDPITWTEATEILSKDDRDFLELEWIRKRGNLDLLLRPLGAPLGNSLLHAAIDNDAKECFDFVLSKITKEQMNEPNDQGSSPLHMSVKIKQKNMMLPCMTKLEDNNSKLHFYRSPYFVKKLKDAGAFVNSRDCEGNTPLHKLVQQCVETTKLGCYALQKSMDILLKDQETDIDAVNNEGKTPLDLIDEQISDTPNNVSQTIQKLFENGARSFKISKVMLTFHGTRQVQAPVSRKKRQDFSKILHFLISRNEPEIKSFFKNYSKDNLQAWENNYIGNKLFLSYIVENYDKEVVECCLFYGCDPWKQDDKHLLPLEVALAKGDYQVSHVLIEYMKAKNGQQIINLRESTLSLYEAIFRNSDRKNKPIGVDYHKCLKRLLKPDVILKEFLEKEHQEYFAMLVKHLNDVELIKILVGKGKKTYEPYRIYPI